MDSQKAASLVVRAAQREVKHHAWQNKQARWALAEVYRLLRREVIDVSRLKGIINNLLTAFEREALLRTDFPTDAEYDELMKTWIPQKAEPVQAEWPIEQMAQDLSDLSREEVIEKYGFSRDELKERTWAYRYGMSPEKYIRTHKGV